MSDIRIDLDFDTHPKIIKLKRRTGDTGLLCLIRLWCYAAKHRSNGVLTDMDAEDVAIACCWSGNEQDFVDTLKQLRLLDQTEEGTYALHNWEQRNPWAANSEERSELARKAVNARWNKRNDTERIRSVYDANAESNTPSPSPSPIPTPSPKEEKSGKSKDSAQAPDTQTAPPSAPTAEPATTATATAPPPTASIPDEFEAFWREYPQRAGGNPKNQALKSWNARIKEGHSADELLAGTRRYAAFCAATGKVGGEYVKQARTFLGQDKFFTEAWDLPTPANATPHNGQRYTPPQAITPEGMKFDAILQNLNTQNRRPVIEGECYASH